MYLRTRKAINPSCKRCEGLVLVRPRVWSARNARVLKLAQSMNGLHQCQGLGRVLVDDYVLCERFQFYPREIGIRNSRHHTSSG
jgi:hypothetical protein